MPAAASSKRRGCSRKTRSNAAASASRPSSAPSRALSQRTIKSSAPRIHPSSCNSSLNKSQSKLTNRQPRARHHTQLWEKVPGHPYYVRIAERRRHRSILRLTLCATAIPSWTHLTTCTLIWKLSARACCSRDRLRLPRKRRRGYESALSASWVSLSASGRTRGGRTTIHGASWVQGMCKGRSSWSIDMRLLVSRLRMKGTLLDGAYS